MLQRKTCWNIVSQPLLAREPLNQHRSHLILLISITGQSESPVLREGTNTVIGTHVYGGEGLNAASVINGTSGNRYDEYIAALLDSDLKPINEVKYTQFVVKSSIAPRITLLFHYSSIHPQW